MSLKAKLEAVIYAAEEPVTLAQLAALFASDALGWKAEQAAEAAAINSEAAAIAPLPLNSAGLAFLGIEETDTVPATFEPSPDPIDPAAGPFSELGQAASPASSPETGPAPGAESSADAELEARRLARLRDREIRAILRQLLDELIASYASDARGIEIREIAGGFRMATKPECHDAVRSFVRSLKPALKLSLPALETLAVIAYKQPVTAPEVNEIRGVDSSGVFGSLLARKLIATAGRKQVIGRPILYKTTREFLLRFGLKDVAELPSIEEFEKMAAMELDEPEFASTSEAAPSTSLNLSLELDEPVEESSVQEESSVWEQVDRDFSPKIGPDESPRALAPEVSSPESFTGAPEPPEPTLTAATAASYEPPAASPAIQAAPSLAEAAPSACFPAGQAEIESFPDAEEEEQAQNRSQRGK